MEKREVIQEQKKGFSVADIILIGVLLAAGAVLKFFVGSMFTVVKPNFIIAMYCLGILLIRPRFFEALIIGVIAGVVCQLFPGTPYVNLISEPIGAIVMYLLIKIPMNVKKFSLHPIVATFISTLASGFTFVGIVYLVLYAGANVAEPAPMDVFTLTVLGTALINSIIVQVLYIPLKMALKK